MAKRIVRLAGVAGASKVVEIGPGTGAFTAEILASLAPESRFLAIERNRHFVKHLKQRFPTAEIMEGCATNIAAILRDQGVGSAESMVSGLPWANFEPGLQTQILSSIRSVMEPGATFTTFAYFGPHFLPTGRRFQTALRAMFSTVDTSPVEMLNFPPAFVYYCKA